MGESTYLVTPFAETLFPLGADFSFSHYFELCLVIHDRCRAHCSSLVRLIHSVRRVKGLRCKTRRHVEIGGKRSAYFGGGGWHTVRSRGKTLSI